MPESRIDVPNTHVLYDPSYARAEAQKHFDPWLRPGEQIIREAADLLLRAMKASEHSVADLVVVGGMFRQLIVAGDGCVLCLGNGAVQQAFLHSRAVFESSLALHWTLKHGKERWARQYYVSSLRQNRIWLRRMIPGSEEADSFERAWAGIGPSPTRTRVNIEGVEKDLKQIDQLLHDAHYEKINESFDQYGIRGKGKRRFYEPNWYEPGDGGARSIADLAHDLDREAEYTTLYKYASYFTHGSLADNHFKVRENRVAVEPIRYLKQFALAFNTSMQDVVQGCLAIAELYRASEVTNWRERYRVEWAPALRQFAEVNVEPILVDF